RRTAAPELHGRHRVVVQRSARGPAATRTAAMVRAWLTAGLAGLALALSPAGGRAAELPLWELAVGGGVISLPYYRGAESNRLLPVPFIYPVYRGDFLKVDEEGVRGLFFETDRLKLDLSADGSVPGSDDDVEGREGMPDLDPTFQVGPSLTVDLWRAEPHARSLILTLPLRGVFTVDSSPEHIGLAASPKLTYSRDARFARRNWRVAMTGGVELGSSKLHDHFYSVAPRFSTPDRPAYKAESGYAGTRFTLSAQSRSGNNWIGAFLRYDNVSGAVFDDSPLVRRSGNFSAGIVVGWFVARSKTMVTVPDREALKD
ncbi:MAG TPA: MipA/OmpV family protein, partial [Arenicellales bacterium]|nr:MipA/OmpV family protein [Arenicellales bacterium]